MIWSFYFASLLSVLKIQTQHFDVLKKQFIIIIIILGCFLHINKC